MTSDFDPSSALASRCGTLHRWAVEGYAVDGWLVTADAKLAADPHDAIHIAAAITSHLEAEVGETILAEDSIDGVDRRADAGDRLLDRGKLAAAAGGRPDLSRFSDHCVAHPNFFDCTLMKTQPRGTTAPWPVLRDARIKAIVVAAPALGFAFGDAGLAAIRIPVQLWRADDDHILPAPFYADAVKVALPKQPEFHTVPGAGHFDFLAPCADPASMPQICKSAPGFDRAAFHDSFDKAVVQFFRTSWLRNGSTKPPQRTGTHSLVSVDHRPFGKAAAFPINHPFEKQAERRAAIYRSAPVCS